MRTIFLPVAHGATIPVDRQRNRTNCPSVKGKRALSCFVLAAALAALAGCASAEAGQPRRDRRYLVAVFALENRSPEKKIEKFLPRVQELMIAELFKTKKMRLVERERLNTLLKEQALGESGMVQAADAEKAGRLAGADAVLIGSMSDVKFHTQKSGIGIESTAVKDWVNDVASRINGSDKKSEGSDALGGETTSVSIRMNARIVHATTGEIISAAEGEAKIYLGSKDNLIIFNRTDKVSEDSALAKGFEDAIKKMIPRLVDGFPLKD